MGRIEAGLRRAIESTAEPEPNVTVPMPNESNPQPAFADEFRFAEADAGEAIEPVLVAREEPRDAAPEPPQMRVRRIVDDKLIVSSDMTPLALEQYRRVAALLHQMQADRQCRVVMVASAIAGEGKTLTACNLALTLTESFHRRVLLIDADLRRPSVHRVFRLDNGSGLNEGLRAAQETKLSIVEQTERLSILPAGRPDPDPMSSLTSQRMRQIVEEASARFDWVILDTPPIALLPDANLLSEIADVVLLVIGAGMTPLGVIERAVNALDRSRIAGVVLNRVSVQSSQYSYYAHYAAVAEQGRVPA